MRACNKTRNAARFGLAAIALAALAACGGGGDDDAPVAAGPDTPVAPGTPTAPTTPVTPGTPVTPVTPATTGVVVTVMDGLIRNAVVCLDVNGNGACDNGEPQAERTGPDGKTTLQVPNADVGKYPVLALMDSQSIDAESGPVTVPYAMTAPADRPGLVTPLTTFVQQMVGTLGISSADAAALVQAQAGLAASPLADYMAGGDKRSALSAYLLAAAMQQQITRMGTGPGNASLNAADVRKAVLADLGTALAAAVAPAGDGAFQAACVDRTSAACKSATANVTATLLADGDLTPANLATVVAFGKLAPDAPAPALATPAASFSLDWIAHADPSNWYFRVNTSTAAEATPDANGLIRYRGIRHEKIAGVETVWGVNANSARKGDLHWDGAAWSGCDAAQQSTGTVRDAQGRSSYNYCKNLSAGLTQRVLHDVAGKPMAEVFGLIQASRTNGAQWGKPADVSGTSFPVGAKLIVQNEVSTASAPGYDVRPVNEVTVADNDVFIGGDATVNSAVGCNQPQNNNATPAPNLETLISHNPGKPCIFAPGTVTGVGNAQFASLTPNSHWGNTSIAMGFLGNAPLGTQGNVTSYYTGNVKLRVSFAGGASQAVTYYTCQERVFNGSTRSCVVVGSGSYAIATLGDGRVMTFTSLPPAFGAQSYERVFVERGGKVFFGFKEKPSFSRVVRLNDVAGNAVFTRLGLPTFQP